MPERVVVIFFNDHSLVVSKRTRIFLIFELYIYILYLYIKVSVNFQIKEIKHKRIYYFVI